MNFTKDGKDGPQDRVLTKTKNFYQKATNNKHNGIIMECLGLHLLSSRYNRTLLCLEISELCQEALRVEAQEPAGPSLPLLAGSCLKANEDPLSYYGISRRSAPLNNSRLEMDTLVSALRSDSERQSRNL